MADLFVRTYTFVDGSTAYGSQVEAEIGNIVTVLNNLNTGTSTWGIVSSAHATSVPLIADCSSGTQHIADFKNNSVIKASFSSAGLLTCAGATVSATADFTGQLKGKGTATNDSAAAGYVGEYVSSFTTGNVGTSGQYADLTSISLTAGDWDVSLLVNVFPNGATVTRWNYGVGKTAGNNGPDITSQFPDDSGEGALPPTTAIYSPSMTIPALRVSLSTTTTVYAKVACTYTVATPSMRGRISARRVR